MATQPRRFYIRSRIVEGLSLQLDYALWQADAGGLIVLNSGVWTSAQPARARFVFAARKSRRGVDGISRHRVL
jgi:hypothetical protein